MGKPKSLLNMKPAKAQKAKPVALRTADDFQEAADVEEETGGKWRAGDQAKSSRAFQRAIQIYNDGLQKHPKDFDLAYNKARLELELTQQPSLVAKLPISLVELLQQALASHRYALRLNEENADILFNTAQVMISIAEHAADAGAGAEIIPLLQEALEILSACFSRQEMLREEQRADFAENMDNDGGVSINTDEDLQAQSQDIEGQSSSRAAENTTDSEPEEQSATIQAPITTEDLLDTTRASLSALTLLVALSDASALPTLSQMAQTLTETTLPRLLSELSDQDRAETALGTALERADFIATLANAEFKSASPQIPLEDILARLKFLTTDFDLSTNVPAMCIYADALVELASTATSFREPSAIASTCWVQLTQAQGLYARAIKVNDAESRDRKAQIYESRGDVEMLRFRLAKLSGEETGLSAAVRASAPTLSKNAGTYYRGAANLFKADGAVGAAKKAEVRGLIAAVLEGRVGGEWEMQAEVLRKRGDEAAAVAMHMMREGLLAPDWDQGLS